MNRDEALNKIFNHFGLETQQRKFNEEVFELQQAINDYWWASNTSNRNLKDAKDHIAEEICDCLVLIKQFINHFEIPKESIMYEMSLKIDRTLKRIDENYYYKT